MLSFLVLFAFGGDLAFAGPVTWEQKIQKRQDTFGVIPGVPPALAGAVMPLITTSGMLPSIVKSGINGMILEQGCPSFILGSSDCSMIRGLWKGS
jgi:hypothetical protein